MLRRPETVANQPGARARMNTGASGARGAKWILLGTLVLVGGGVAATLHFGGFLKKQDPELDARAGLAARAREQASPQHPKFAAAAALFVEAQLKQEAGLLGQASSLYDQSIEAFKVCGVYDETLELAAVEAGRAARLRGEGQPDATLAVANLGDERLSAAKQKVAEGDYAAAYQLFEQAAFYYQYDASGERDARYATLRANPAHPAYAAAQEKLRAAQSLLEKRPLAQDDLDQARGLFDEVVKGLADAMPYDDTIESVAVAARGGAEKSNPQYLAAEAAFQEALQAKIDGDFGKAYGLFAKARDSFLMICAAYVSVDEEFADSARRAADPESPLYDRAQAPFDEAERALKSGKYDVAYAKFREARDLFNRATNFDEELAAEIEALRSAADAKNPAYTEGERHYQSALQHRDAREYRLATGELQLARGFFERARPYDDRVEQSALHARDEAYAEMPVTYAAGVKAFEAAASARDAGRTEEAYEQFREAARLFRLARFDPSILASLEVAKSEADPQAAEYSLARSAEQEGRDAFEQGDGRRAAAKLELATVSYQAVKRAAPPPLGDPTKPVVAPPVEPRPTDSDRAARLAQRAAKIARIDATDRKDVCDTWREENSITRSTLGFYEEGNREWDAAEIAHERSDWAEAERGYRAALSSWQKVSNQRR